MRGVIALDIGGVCIQLRQRAFLEELGLSETPRELQAINIAFETGLIGADDWLAQCQRQVPALQAIEPTALWKSFRSIIGGDQTGMAELTRHWTNSGYKLIFFSNTSPVHAEEVWKKISFAERISGAVYSYETGYMKPNPEMYRCFEERYGRPTLYLDDTLGNVEQGLKIGWPARLFTGADELLREFGQNT
jgi:FMN phosphatase YigB (HAD superfamily)